MRQFCLSTVDGLSFMPRQIIARPCLATDDIGHIIQKLVVIFAKDSFFYHSWTTVLYFRKKSLSWASWLSVIWSSFCLTNMSYNLRSLSVFAPAFCTSLIVSFFVHSFHYKVSFKRIFHFCVFNKCFIISPILHIFVVTHHLPLLSPLH